MQELNTTDIKNIFIEKYKNKEFRIIGNDSQQSKTVEIQNAHFVVDKPWILREPNYDYAKREIEWYKIMSLNVNDIPGDKIPKMWLQCADKDGYINSNYGWCIWSKDNNYQYEHCKQKLIEDPHTREACMIYNRPSMQDDYCKNGMHEFMCTYAVQCFINEDNLGKKYLDYIVYMRSNDAVFGFDNDVLWHMYVQKQLANDLNINVGKIYWNASSLHVYERHFKYLV